MNILKIGTDINNNLFLDFKYQPQILEAIKTIPSRKWNDKSRVHYIGKYDLDSAIKIFQSFGYEVQFTPGAEALLKDHFEKRKKMIDIKNLQWSNEYLLEYQEKLKLKLPLRPFQVLGTEFLVNAKCCLLADDMGCGKTIMCISAFLALKQEGKVFKMLVLCPNSVKGAWKNDIIKFTDLKYQVIEGDYNKRKEQYKNEYDILIMSYDTFLVDFGITEKKKANREPIPVPQIDIITLDECQRLVRAKNKITQSIFILKEKLDLKYIYLLTGTPIVNRIEDLWSLLYLIDSGIVSEFWSFRNRYCEIEYEEIKMLDPKKRKQGIFEKIIRKIPHVVGYKNLEELKDKIAPFYIRREKRDVLKELPDKIFETYDIEITGEQREMYNILKNDFLNAFRGLDVNASNVLTWGVRAKQICDSSELVDPSSKSSAKFDELKDLLNDLIKNDNHKVVLFSQYKQMTDILVRDLAEYNPLYLHGQVNSPDRQLLIDAFQSPESKYKLFISTLKAGGVGITLTNADICIMYDSWWSPSANNQAIDRLYRIGQVNPVTVINFVCKDTIEERILKILEKKELMFSGVFGDDESILVKLTSQELKELL